MQSTLFQDNMVRQPCEFSWSVGEIDRFSVSIGYIYIYICTYLFICLFIYLYIYVFIDFFIQPFETDP